MNVIIPKWPKIYTMGHRYNRDLFDVDYPVQVTEKVDGSQFSFYLGKSTGLVQRSKGAILNQASPNKLFRPAVNYVNDLVESNDLPEGIVCFSETLCKSRHNLIKYDRVPKNHIALFGAYDTSEDVWFDYRLLCELAEEINVDVVPAFQMDLTGEPFANIQKFFETESFLGGHKIEGIVMIDYHRDYVIGDVYYPFKGAKYVSEEYKEKHTNKAYGAKARKQGWDEYCQTFRTEARWQKAVQHLRERGDLTGELKDIGTLIKEVQVDITEEEKETILEYLWKQYGKQLLRVATHGLPEWFKQQLAEGKIDI